MALIHLTTVSSVSRSDPRRDLAFRTSCAGVGAMAYPVGRPSSMAPRYPAPGSLNGSDGGYGGATA